MNIFIKIFLPQLLISCSLLAYAQPPQRDVLSIPQPHKQLWPLTSSLLNQKSSSPLDWKASLFPDQKAQLVSPPFFGQLYYSQNRTLAELGNQANAGKCLDAPDPNHEGGRIHLWDCHGGPQQQWQWQGQQLISSGGKCLEVSDPYLDGAFIYLATCADNNRQYWQLHNGQLLTAGERCLEALDPYTNGSDLDTWRCDERRLSQQWSYSDTQPSPTTERYLIQSHDGKCLDAPQPFSIGSIVYLWDCYGGPNQQWQHQQGALVSTGGLCLDAPNPAATGGIVYLWHCYYGTNQQWRVENDQIISSGDRCLSTPTIDVIPKAFYLWDCHQGPTQQWNLKPLR